MNTYTIDIRPRRQTTLPQQLLNAIGVDVGDTLTAEIRDQEIVLRSKRRLALDAFIELQAIIRESGIPEKEMQDNLQKTRQEIYEKKIQDLP